MGVGGRGDRGVGVVRSWEGGGARRGARGEMGGVGIVGVWARSYEGHRVGPIGPGGLPWPFGPSGLGVFFFLSFWFFCFLYFTIAFYLFLLANQFC